MENKSRLNNILLAAPHQKDRSSVYTQSDVMCPPGQYCSGSTAFHLLGTNDVQLHITGLYCEVTQSAQTVNSETSILPTVNIS